ncbi:glycerol-3-phosphate 1-O-acyltransferase PlsB [Litoribrevibacter albus]|uniref:Glycerol-3-phosphate acyltransferase n=1 Tax=Litoribrevibacter albus TaxID=1473156 RepID=A0AA37S9V5_9GAMM|nr:glycerol-3-phosphate 1-O-acyltransferase PlsB [Litoribrevibacter albus]GLQ31216.1 glycerol-3-phosphate acyltransferase [Litoribrevibacter albus]
MKNFNLAELIFRFFRTILAKWMKTTVQGGSPKELGLDPNQPVLYAIRGPSLSAQLVIDQECNTRGLPSIRAPLPEPFNEKRSYITLNKRQGSIFSKRWVPVTSDRLLHSIETLQKNAEFDVQVVPVTVIWGRNPDKEKSLFRSLFSDNWSSAGKIQQFFTVLIHGRDTLVQFSKPISLRSIMKPEEPAERTAKKIQRILRVHQRRSREAIVGPDLSHRRTLMRSLLHSNVMRQAIQKEAEEHGISIEKAEKRALKYADELASNMSYSTIRFLEVILGWVWNKIYDGIEINHLENLEKVARANSIVYVPCHRSHVDYLLLSYILYQNGYQPPHIAAGINLNIPVIGSILRRGGAFFMRRSFKGNPLYSSLFNEYMHTMFTRGFSVEYFVEGGRSRTGRQLTPKAGMLAMTVRSFLRDSKKPIKFMPIYVGYEKILEGNTYLGELRGANKEKESVGGLFKALKHLRNSFGKVRMNFGHAIDLKTELDNFRPGWRDEDYGDDYRPDWLNAFVDQLSTQVATSINSSVSVNPINMIGAVLLATPKQALSEHVLVDQLNRLKKLLSLAPYSEQITLPEGSGEDWIKYAEGMKVIDRKKHSLGDIILMDETQAVLLTYYRNNILHLLAVPSLICLLSSNNRSLERGYVVRISKWIYPYLQNELFLHWSEDEIEDNINQWIDALVDEGLIHVDGNCLMSPEPGGSDFVTLQLMGQPIMATLERYYIAIELLRIRGQEALTAEELQQQSTAMAERLSILHGLNAPEFFDKALFRDLVSILLDRGVITKSEDDKLTFDQQIETIAEDARLILNSQVRHSILQITRDQGSEESQTEENTSTESETNETVQKSD